MKYNKFHWGGGKNLIVEMGCLTAGYSQKTMPCCFFLNA